MIPPFATKARISSRDVATGRRCTVLERSIGLLLRVRLRLRLRLVLVAGERVRSRERPRLGGVRGDQLCLETGVGERLYRDSRLPLGERLSYMGLRLRTVSRRRLGVSSMGVRPREERPDRYDQREMEGERERERERVRERERDGDREGVRRCL